MNLADLWLVIKYLPKVFAGCLFFFFKYLLSCDSLKHFHLTALMLINLSD